MEKWANFSWGLVRNKYAGDSIERNTMIIDLIDVRDQGCYLTAIKTMYDRETVTLKEIGIKDWTEKEDNGSSKGDF
jgi:hypothetical protein